MTPEESTRADNIRLITAEGVCDYWFGRPFDLNPYSRVSAPAAWNAWRDGWTYGSEMNAIRGDVERRRWLLEAA